MPAVIALQTLPASRAAKLLQALYPKAIIRVQGSANALVVIARPDDLASIRMIATAIDIKDPSAPVVEAIPLHVIAPGDAASRLQALYPGARITPGPNRVLMVAATQQTLTEIHAVLSALDAAPATPAPKPNFPATVIHVTQANPRDVARAVARTAPNVQLFVSGSNIIARGDPDAVTTVKALVTQLDVAPVGSRYTQVYRISAVDAHSIADLLSRSFHDADFIIDSNLNSIGVTATSHVQARIADAIAQLDVAPGTPGQNQPQGSFGGARTEVVELRAAVPGASGAPSTTSADIAQTVTQALGATASDLHITVQPNSTRLVLSGSEQSIAAAKDLIAKLDVAEPLVELDTEVYEIDESTQKQIGFKFPSSVLSSTYSELTPATNASGTTPQLLSLQPLTRSPLSLQAELDFLVSTNKAKILEDPRITTFSGRTASLRAGETVNILTTTGGGTGTVATTQVQSFQTGVTLDITPVVNADDYVTVTLHPSVNTEAGISAAGVPNIQTRDTTTTVGLHDGETIAIGGLIEDSDSRSVQKIPLLGDIPIIGRLFQDVGVTHTRNELIVTVTPHILKPGTRNTLPLPIDAPSPAPLPTLPTSATLPPARPVAQRIPPGAAPSAAPTPITDAAQAAGSKVSPGPSASPSSSPAALPSAFAQTNTFTFGSAPPNNFADNNAPPQIFFIQAAPTVVKNGQAVTIAVITSSNVSTLTLGPSAGAPLMSLSAIGTGKWQSTFTFTTANLPASNGIANELLTATTGLGASTSIRIPFTIVGQ